MDELKGTPLPINEIVAALANVLDKATPLLKTIDAEQAAFTPSPLTWSIKEIVAHLVDSAANNHGRFVRAQGVTKFTLTPYQTFWVDAQHYDSASPELVDLGRLYKRHLDHVISHLPADKLNTLCIIDASTAETGTPGFLVEDYLVHLRHHLEQIEQRMNG